ncbi:HlyD family secretion protein [Methyloraptor flagellatus]|uniref:HlyD family efflux transporter periplasmic adaptor subunit n=1 Tax=Methyloraptor flagellatus TaxID=3162530 RepID=A0AAU7XF10_9HYPH
MRAATVAVVLAALVAGGWYGFDQWRKAEASKLPAGITSANGRIEVNRVDIAAKVPGRIAEIRVREGDYIAQDAIVAVLDQAEVRAQLAAARATAQRAVQGIARAHAEVAAREADLNLAEVVLKRSAELRDRAVNSQADLDQRTAQRDVAAAAVNSAKAAVGDAVAAKDVAEAQVAQIEASIADMTLKAPMGGRVEYRLVEPGEVVGAGGKVATLLDLTDVYMTVFLPTRYAGRVKLGGEARIVLDAAKDYVIPARISFVAAEAQFTPKAVETESEREKLMYRIKVQVDRKILDTYRDYVKSGLTGMAYVLVSPDAAWPAWLEPKLPDVKS